MFLVQAQASNFICISSEPFSIDLISVITKFLICHSVDLPRQALTRSRQSDSKCFKTKEAESIGCPKKPTGWGKKNSCVKGGAIIGYLFLIELQLIRKQFGGWLYIMVNATKGVFISCDIPMAQYIISMNASLPASEKFIIHVLDNTHIFVQPHVEHMIRSQIAKFREDNTYVKPN